MSFWRPQPDGRMVMYDENDNLTLQVGNDSSLYNKAGTQILSGNGGSLSAATDVTLTSDTLDAATGDIIFKTGDLEIARFVNDVGLGIGITSGLAAPLHVRIPGTGTLIKLEPSGGGAQYYHANELGFAAVGDNTNLPYIAVENNTVQDIKLAFSVSNAAGNIATIQSSSVSGGATPSLQILAPTGDIYIKPGNGTSTGKINLWAGSSNGVRIQKSDGTNTVFQGIPNTNAIAFFAATAVTKQTVTGAKGSNAALASLLTALANYGLVTDSSTA